MDFVTDSEEVPREKLDEPREQLAFKPTWKGPIEGWATNHINRNLWKVTPRYDFDDLFQDAYLFFLICCERYTTVSTPQHFMSLFQRCLSNHILDLAAKRTKEAQVSANVILNESGDDLISTLKAKRSGLEEVESAILIEDAVGPLANIAEALLMVDEEDLPKYHRARGRVRETTEQYLRRIAKVDDSVPIVEIVAAYLEGELLPC
jgi:DNA-directed RNA polymerase specialized sigma24 family protein